MVIIANADAIILQLLLQFSSAKQVKHIAMQVSYQYLLAIPIIHSISFLNIVAHFPCISLTLHRACKGNIPPWRQQKQLNYQHLHWHHYFFHTRSIWFVFPSQIDLLEQVCSLISDLLSYLQGFQKIASASCGQKVSCLAW